MILSDGWESVNFAEVMWGRALLPVRAERSSAAFSVHAGIPARGCPTARIRAASGPSAPPEACAGDSVSRARVPAPHNLFHSLSHSANAFGVDTPTSRAITTQAIAGKSSSGYTFSPPPQPSTLPPIKD